MLKRSAIIIFPLMILAVISLLWLGSSSAASQASKIAEKEMQNFKYTIVANDKDEVFIHVDPKATNALAIEKYKDEVTQISQKHANANKSKKLDLTVTLKKPIGFEQFRKMLDTYSFEPNVIAIRTFSSSGERGTISGLLEKGKGFPQADIDRILLSLKERGKSVTVMGIINFDSSMLGNNYASLASEKDVFVADGVEAVLREEAKNLKSNAKSTKFSGFLPYWLMEDFGLVKY